MEPVQFIKKLQKSRDTASLNNCLFNPFIDFFSTLLKVFFKENQIMDVCRSINSFTYFN